MNKDEPKSDTGELPYPRRGEWLSIINPDIKPMNVMLGEAQDEFYPGFKTTKMIDFGLCCNDDRYNFSDNKYYQGYGVGTPGFCAPVSFCNFITLRWE